MGYNGNVPCGGHFFVFCVAVGGTKSKKMTDNKHNVKGIYLFVNQSF